MAVEARLWLILNSIVSENEKKFVCGRAVPLCLCCHFAYAAKPVSLPPHVPNWDARPILFLFSIQIQLKRNQILAWTFTLYPLCKSVHFELRLNENSTRFGLGLPQIEKYEKQMCEICYLLSSRTQAPQHLSSSS